MTDPSPIDLSKDIADMIAAESKRPYKEHRMPRGPSPIDTIREAIDRLEALNHIGRMKTADDARAALTEVEQQLAEAPNPFDVVAMSPHDAINRAQAAEQRATDLADALRQIEAGLGYPILYREVARAALDRHTQEQT